MYSNMVAAVIRHERIETTETKAKELRRFVERTITWASSLGELLKKEPEARSVEEKARYLHHLRMAKRVLRDGEALDRLFTEVAPRFVERAGGYTRTIKTRRRRGDNAPMVYLELVDYVPSSPEPAAPEKTKASAEAE
jgi:large subunit ribosomal protein L17